MHEYLKDSPGVRNEKDLHLTMQTTKSIILYL